MRIGIGTVITVLFVGLSTQVLPAQLSMGRPANRKMAAASPEQDKRFAEALSGLSPKERKQIAKAMKRLTPEGRAQLTGALKRQLVEKKPATLASKRPR